MTYRPHLDGLRTVAVYLVVAFHAGLAEFRGGFVGVDIFFVLSGFLVTRILLRDLASHGRIQWRRFYAGGCGGSSRPPSWSWSSPLAAPPSIWSIDLDRLVCPRLPHCDPVVGNVIVKRDWSHLTGTYSSTLADPIFAILHRQHIL
jgi:hypothetical protein